MRAVVLLATTCLVLLPATALANSSAPLASCAAAASLFQSTQKHTLVSVSLYQTCISQHFARKTCRSEFATAAQDQARLEAAVAQVADRCGQ
jgi:hypothetical protein